MCSFNILKVPACCSTHVFLISQWPVRSEPHQSTRSDRLLHGLCRMSWLDLCITTLAVPNFSPSNVSPFQCSGIVAAQRSFTHSWRDASPELRIPRLSVDSLQLLLL